MLNELFDSHFSCNCRAFPSSSYLSSSVTDSFKAGTERLKAEQVVWSCFGGGLSQSPALGAQLGLLVLPGCEKCLERGVPILCIV